MNAQFSRDQWLYEELELHGLDAEGEALNQVELYRCEVLNAKLSGATLKRWVFEECTFRDCDLSNITWEGCTFEGCTFRDCRLIGSDWRHIASLTAAVNFERCDLSMSQLSGVRLLSSRFEGSRCIDVDFSQADLSESVWLETEVTDALFEESKLNKANLTGAIGEQFDPQTSQLNGALVSITTAIRLAESLGLFVDHN